MNAFKDLKKKYEDIKSCVDEFLAKYEENQSKMSSEHVTLHKNNLEKVVDNTNILQEDTFLEGNLIEQIMETDDLIKLKELMEKLQDALVYKINETQNWEES